MREGTLPDHPYLAEVMLVLRAAWEYGGGIDFLELPPDWAGVALIMAGEMNKPQDGDTTQEIPLGGNKFRRITKGKLI